MNRPVATLALFAFLTSLPGGGDLYSQCSQTKTRTWTESSFECPYGQGGGEYNPACYDLVYGTSETRYTEIWDFTESTKFCFTGDCSPGQMSSTLEQNLRFAGNIYCDQMTLIPIPYADPEICNVGCDAGPDGAGSASLWFKMRISSPVGSDDAHFLWIHQKQVDRRLYTPGALFLPNEKGLKIYRNPDYSIRQVISPTYLANVHVTSPTSYEVAIHAISPGEDIPRDAEGYLAPLGKPLRTYRFSNPEPDTLSAFRIETLAGPSRQTREFHWDDTQAAWSLSNNAETTQQTASIEHYDKEKGLFTKTARTTDLASGLHRDTVRVFRDYPFGRRLISTEKRLAGKSISTDVYTYGEDLDQPGTYTRLLSRQLHDGSWERFEYDQRGRLVKKLSPWKDSPFDSPENAVRVEAYGYLDIDPASLHYHPTAQFARIDEVITGVKVATTYRLTTRDPIDGANLRIEERAATAGAHFGEAGNARTTSRYYPEREADPASGQLRSTESPDGSVVSYCYESGDYEGEEGIGQFTARVGGPYTRTIRINGTAAHPDGIPGRSLASISVESSLGTTLLEERRLVQEGDPAGGALLSWSGHAYDDNGHRILSRDSTGIIAEYRHNSCCNEVEWQRDRNGVETFYTRDADKRVTARVVKAPGRPEVETHFDYGPFGQVIKETIVAGDLVQETTHEFDDEGELIATTTPDGLKTRYEHDHTARTQTTILPGGATQVETHYLDGQTKSVTGSALVAQYYDYGVTPDTGDRWTHSTAAKADGPRWSRAYTDALGRSLLQEQPGHGHGIILSSHTAYDHQGRPVATQTGWKKSANGADGGREGEFTPVGPATLYTYDAATGELLLSGQDLDRDDKLTPGTTDRLAKSESRIEKTDNHWWQVTRQWSYPVELKGQPYLVGESRQRLTGLGTPNEDPTLGVLVSETVQIAPAADDSQPQKGAEALHSRSTTYRNRESGLVATITTDPSGLTTVQTTQGGLLASIESKTANSKTATRFEYDSLSRRIRSIDPRTGESKVAYDPKTGQVIAQVDPEGRITRYAYFPADHPSAGRLARTANPAGKEQNITYTLRGEQRGIWGDSVQPLHYEYNEYGERVTMRTFQTLPNGDPSHEEDKGAKTNWQYDEATGALLKKAYADGNGPEYTYTEAGQLKERQWTREISPQSAQRTTEEEEKTSSPTNGAAAPVGTPRLGVRPGQRLTTDYEYDALTAQLTQTTSTDGTNVTYAYNSEGQLQKVTDATGTREFTYDLRGQITKELITLKTGKDTPPLTYEIARAYTTLGQPESVHLVSTPSDPASDPDNLKPGTLNLKLDHKVAYTWNAHNQLSSVKSLAGEFVYGYDANNPALLTKMTGPAHEVETTYEPHRNLITGVSNWKLGSRMEKLPSANAADPIPAPDSPLLAPVSSYTYANDLLGRRETISQGGQAFAMLKLGENKVDVAYNDRSEVTGVVYKSANEVKQQFTYDFDGIGNRKRSASEIGSQKSEVNYTTNALNQYGEIKTSSVVSVGNSSHDLDGNFIEDAKNRYTWDAENRLVRVDSKDGKLHLDYTYDYQSRRTVRIETKEPGTKHEEQRTTYYLYDAWNVIAEVSASRSQEIGPGSQNETEVSQLGTLNFNPATLYSWGRDLSGSLQGTGGVGGLLAISSNHTQRYPAYAANGNVSQILDEVGAITAAYTYDPFGNVTEMEGAEADANPWRFSTKPVDAGTGWLYYGYRWLDAGMGRWLSRDPIAEEVGPNLYTFVGNDGVDGVDWLGLAEPIVEGCFYVWIPILRGNANYPAIASPSHGAWGFRGINETSVTIYGASQHGFEGEEGIYDVDSREWKPNKNQSQGKLYECCCLTQGDLAEIKRRHEAIKNWKDPDTGKPLGENTESGVPVNCSTCASMVLSGMGSANLPNIGKMDPSNFTRDPRHPDPKGNEVLGERNRFSEFWQTPVILWNQLEEAMKSGHCKLVHNDVPEGNIFR